jgi:tryptophan-rich sensory protein
MSHLMLTHTQPNPPLTPSAHQSVSAWAKSPVTFSFGILALGMLSAFVGFLFADPAQNVQTLPTLLNLPAWFFWMVWIIIYPALGAAVWHVWRNRETASARPALIYFGLYLLSNMAFVPLTALIPGVWTAFLLDVVGLIGGIVLALLFARVTRPGVWWLLPLLVWLPITTINKVPAILVLLS